MTGDEPQADRSFGARLAAVFAREGRLSVGIDPHPETLAVWGLDDTAEGAKRLGLAVVEACAGVAGIVKPQVACFERFGSAGFRALEAVLAESRQAGLLTIADAKRGDIGSTMASYADAWLSPGSPLEADAVTLTPYVGTGALEPTMRRAASHGKGVFLLAATSNPEARALQGARTPEGASVAGWIVGDVRAFNRRHAGNSAGRQGARVGAAGVVLGATVRLAQAGIEVGPGVGGGEGGVMPVLAPGFGSQGARLTDLEAIYGALTPGVIAHESRSLLNVGPRRLRDEIARHAALARVVDA